MPHDAIRDAVALQRMGWKLSEIAEALQFPKAEVADALYWNPVSRFFGWVPRSKMGLVQYRDPDGTRHVRRVS